VITHGLVARTAEAIRVVRRVFEAHGVEMVLPEEEFRKHPDTARGATAWDEAAGAVTWRWSWAATARPCAPCTASCPSACP
jgi:hypothetical protein